MHCAMSRQFIPSLIAGASHSIEEKRSLADAVLFIRVHAGRPSSQPDQLTASLGGGPDPECRQRGGTSRSGIQADRTRCSLRLASAV